MDAHTRNTSLLDALHADRLHRGAISAHESPASCAQGAEVGQLTCSVFWRLPVFGTHTLVRIGLGQNETHVVPGAGTTNVRALVAGELIDQYPSVAIEIDGAFTATTGAARRDSGAVCLPRVLEGARLERVSLCSVGLCRYYSPCHPRCKHRLRRHTETQGIR